MDARMSDLAVSLVALLMLAIVLLIIVLGCLDETTAENRRLRAAAARRVRELDEENHR